MGRVYKRAGSHYYQASWRDAAGKTVRRSTETKNKVDAEKLMKEWERQSWDQRHFGDAAKDLTLFQLKELWFLESAEKKTLNTDQTYWKIILAHLDGERSVSSIKRADLLAFRSALLRSGRRGGARRPATVNRIIMTFAAAMRAAARHEQYAGLVNESSLSKLMLPEENQRDRVATNEEIDTLLAAANPRMRLAIQIAVETTMRLSEVVNLSWEWIRSTETEDGGSEWTIYVPARMHKNKEPKGVPVSSKLRRILEEHRATVAARFEMEVDQVTGPVLLPRPKVAAMSKAFGDLARRVGIEGLHYHDLRATGATRMIERGVDIFTVREITGHRSLHALQRYARMAKAKSKREAIEKISGDS